MVIAAVRKERRMSANLDMMNSDAAPSRIGWVAGYGLTLLFLANLFNYADRTLLGIVVEPIRRELRLNDTQIGIVSGPAFSLFYLIAGVAIARWVDRGNRPLILALGVGLWSAATAATSITHGFVSLGLCRMLIGVGEATVFPVALSLLADLYPGPRLPRSVSIFQSSAGVGVMVGSVLAGLFAAALGWRNMFVLFGAVGLALVLLITFTMQRTARTTVAGLQSQTHGGLLAAMRAIISVPGLGLLVLGYAVSNMMFACLPTWAPTFLFRSHGVTLSQVGAVVGPPAVIGGVAGTILSGILATRLIRRSGDPAGLADGPDHRTAAGGPRLCALLVRTVAPGGDDRHRGDELHAVEFSWTVRCARRVARAADTSRVDIDAAADRPNLDSLCARTADRRHGQRCTGTCLW